MKNLLLFVALMFAAAIQSQNIITDTVYKKGIYKTFEEFRTNSPSIDLKYKIKSYTSKMPMNDWTSYMLDISKEESEAIGPIYGFCNGYSIYVANSPRPAHRRVFEQVLYVGSYSFYQDQGGLDVPIVLMPDGSFTLGASSQPIFDKIIDMKTGKVTILDNKEMKDILADNPALLAEFKKDSKKQYRRMKYLKRYLEQKEKTVVEQH